MITIAAVFVLSAGISHAAAESPDNKESTGLISGSDTLLWLTKSNSDGTFNIYVRQVGKRFKSVVKSMEAQPHKLQAAGNKLHVIYASGVYQIFGDDGAIDTGQNFPGDEVLATCETTDFFGTKGAGIVALVQTSTAKTGDNSASSVPRCALYRNFGNQWELVTSQPVKNADKHLAGSVKIKKNLAFVKGTLYRLDVQESPKSRRQTVKLWALRNLTQWVLVAPKPSGEPKPTWPPHGTASITMLAISERLVFVVASDAKSQSAIDTTQQHKKTQLDIYSYNPETNEIFAPSVVRHNDNNLTWAAADLPRITRSGDKIALLWKSGKDDEMLAQSDMQGGVLQSENLTESIASLPDPEQIQKISNYFIWGIIIILGITMLWPRPRTVPKPFLLPEGIKPGNLLLRLIAFFIDYLPFGFVSMFIFFTREEMKTMSKVKWTTGFTSPETIAGVIPLESFAYWGMVSLGGYILYCVAMEWKFGRTIGKRLMGLRVLADGGKAPKIREVILRNLTKTIELSVTGSPHVWIMGVVMVLFPVLTRYNQRLGDMMARTAVVNAKTVIRITPDVETVSAPPAAKPGRPARKRRDRLNGQFSISDFSAAGHDFFATHFFFSASASSRSFMSSRTRTAVFS